MSDVVRILIALVVVLAVLGILWHLSAKCHGSLIRDVWGIPRCVEAR